MLSNHFNQTGDDRVSIKTLLILILINTISIVMTAANQVLNTLKRIQMTTSHRNGG